MSIEPRVLLNQINSHPILAVLLAACLLFPLSWLGYQTLVELEKADHARSLQKRAEVHFQAVSSALSDLENLLVSLRSYIELHPQLTRQNFDYFVTAQPITDYGIAAFEWIPKVNANQQSAYIARAQADGIFDFDMVTSSSGKKNKLGDLFPIYFISSAQMNGLTLGKNLADDDSLRETLLKAVQSGSLQVGITEAEQDTASVSPEIRLIMPVYHSGAKHSQVDYQNLRGFVTARFRVDEAVSILLGNRLRESSFCLQIRDKNHPEWGLLYQSQFSQSNTPCDYREQDADQIWEQTYQQGATTLSFRFFEQGAPEYLALFSRPNIAAAASLLISLLVLIYLYSSLRYARRIELLVQVRTRSLKTAEDEYLNLFRQAIDGVYRADTNGRLLRLNPAFARTFGFRTEEAMLEQVKDISTQLHHNPGHYEKFLSLLARQGRVTNFEWQGKAWDGRTVWLTENAYLAEDPNGETFYEGSINVITERKQTELLLKRQAEHDDLTGLINRPTFVRQLDRHLQQPSRDKLGAVFFIDLDRFKLVNDTLGHAAGDELLTQFSQRLRHCLRERDVIARFGGDEFAVLVTHQYTTEQIATLADRILESSRQPFTFNDGKHFKTTASIGINLIDDTLKNAEEVLRNADTAMYEVKRKGRGHKVIFNESLNLKMQRRNQLALCLSEALERQELEVHYQPIVALAERKISGFEALLRWYHPKLGAVSPAEFIPIAEEINLIEALGNWVLQEALKQLRQLIQASGNPQLFMNINISPQQLLDPQIADRLTDLLAQYLLGSHNLNIEVTESAIHGHESLVVEHLRQIRVRKIGIYIDDFGTGHSSLERLVNYPVNGLKIDRNFVSQINGEDTKAVVVKGTLMMAELLQLKVTAEGIETDSQLAYLKRSGCELGQGYLLHRPLPATEVYTLMQQRACHPDAEPDSQCTEPSAGALQPQVLHT